jgi:hypothetical protein
MLLSRIKIYRERAADMMRKFAMIFLTDQQKEQWASRARREAFIRIAREERWGESHLSGGGSTIEYTRMTQDILEKVIREYNINSMLDAGCGDFTWMPSVLDRLRREFRYVGIDIVPGIIERLAKEHPQYEFKVVDFVVDELPQCDLIFCRDVIQHLPIKEAIRVLGNFSRSGAKYLLTTTHLRRFGWRNARDKRVGQCHDRNLLLKPFRLADPIAIFSEIDPGHKFLGLWELPLETLEDR